MCVYQYVCGFMCGWVHIYIYIYIYKHLFRIIFKYLVVCGSYYVVYILICCSISYYFNTSYYIMIYLYFRVRIRFSVLICLSTGTECHFDIPLYFNICLHQIKEFIMFLTTPVR